MKQIKTGLIGVSGYGRTHFVNLKNLADQGRAELAAAVVINPDQVADELAVMRQLGTEIYSSADAMYENFSGKLDLVCIPTGIALHERMTEQALAYGANVLVEKPAAGSVEAVRRMMAAEKQSGKFAAVGFQHVYAREIQFIKQYLLSGRLGRVKRIAVMGIWPRNDQYYSRNNWAGILAAADGTPIRDSPVNNAFAHYLNLQLFLSGDCFDCSAHAVSVGGTLYRARESIETFDACALRFRTENGVELISLLAHVSDRNVDPVMRIECERGVVDWQVRNGWSIRSAEGSLLYSGITEQPHTDMFMDMIRKIHGEPVFTCSLAIALEHANCIEMLTEQLTPVVLRQSAHRREPDGQYIIDGLPETFERCFRENRLPEELGIFWR